MAKAELSHGQQGSRLQRRRRPPLRLVAKTRLDALVTLPVPAEINGRPCIQREMRNAEDLLSVCGAAVVFSPCGFLGVPDKVFACDVMGMADFAVAKAGEVGFSMVRAGVLVAVGDFVIDALHLVTRMEFVPGVAFVGVHGRIIGDARLDPVERCGFRLEYARH